MASRLPSPGSDVGTWGDILNDFLSQSLKSDGTLKDDVVTSASLAPDAVDGSALADGSVAVAQLATTSSPSSSQLLSYNGTSLAWVTGSGSGTVPDADATTKGLIQLAGDLTGTAASPAVAAGAITNAKVSGSAAIAYSKLSLAGSIVNADISSSAAVDQSKISGLSTSLSGKAATTTTITGATSLTGGGDLSANRTISLVNDSASPGNSKYYGTNGGGTKGYYDLPSGGGATDLDSLTDVTITSAASGQVLKYNGSAWVNDTDATSGGGGDASTNTSSSVDSEIALFSGTAGKTLKRATGTGLATLTSGVLSTTTAPTGALVGTTDTQTLTNKTISGASNTLSNIAQSSVTSLTTDLAAKAADSAVVHNTGAETVAGVKTFSSSPIVPTPTTSTQAATKDYADSLVTGAFQNVDAVIFYDTGSTSYPLRSTVTTDADRRVRWVGPTAPTIGSGYAIDNLDVWEMTV